MKNTKILRITLAMLLVCVLLAGCGKTEAGVLEYDLDSGADFVLEANVGSSDECKVFVGENRLDKTEYTVGDGQIAISAYSMMFLELNETYTVKIETGSKTQEFQVKLVSTSNVSMDESTVNFNYEAPADVVKSADFGDQTISEIRLGNRTYADTSLYAYDSAAKTLTFNKELLAGLPGNTNILVRLSGGKEFSFQLCNTLLAKVDFEDSEENAALTGSQGVFAGAKLEAVEDGTGNTVGKLVPLYDHIFCYGDHYWGTYGGVVFEKDMTYRVEFDVKPDEASTEKVLKLYLRKAFDSYDPRCGMEPNGEGDDVQKYAYLDFSSGNCTTEGNMTGMTCTYDEATGYTHVVIEFKTSTAYTTIFNCNTGSNYYDSDRLGENGSFSDPTNAENKAAMEAAKSICWYFDNMVVTQQG